MGSGLVWCAVRDEHPDLFSVAAIWPRLFLAEVSGAAGYHPAGDICLSAAVYCSADYRNAAGDVLSRNCALVAKDPYRLAAANSRPAVSGKNPANAAGFQANTKDKDR